MFDPNELDGRDPKIRSIYKSLVTHYNRKPEDSLEGSGFVRFDDGQPSPSPLEGNLDSYKNTGWMAISERTYGRPSVLAWIRLHEVFNHATMKIETRIAIFPGPHHPDKAEQLPDMEELDVATD